MSRIVRNSQHRIIEVNPNANYNYNRYRIYEYCGVIEDFDEVKHPTYKKEILKKYAL